MSTDKPTLAEATKDDAKLSDNVRLVLIGPDGVVKKDITLHNTTTTVLKTTTADQLLASPTLLKPTHGAVGTGTPSGTALGVELGARTVFATKTRAALVVTMTWTVPAGTSTGALIEAGTFDQLALGGGMYTSATFAVINKGASDTLAVTWTITVA